ncbi:MAG: hypothetical protein U5R48_08250, partial [Gammaproteobacteria bacterium]|nr:hypothetical protein [Gammaproteobacteria bacterium]
MPSLRGYREESKAAAARLDAANVDEDRLRLAVRVEVLDALAAYRAAVARAGFLGTDRMALAQENFDLTMEAWRNGKVAGPALAVAQDRLGELAAITFSALDELVCRGHRTGEQPPADSSAWAAPARARNRRTSNDERERDSGRLRAAMVVLCGVLVLAGCSDDGAADERAGHEASGAASAIPHAEAAAGAEEAGVHEMRKVSRARMNTRASPAPATGSGWMRSSRPRSSW